MSKKKRSLFSLTGNKKKIAKNIYWALLGKVINVLASLFVGVLVARYLGPDDYGLMNYVISYVTIFKILSVFGLDNIEIRELSKRSEEFNVILGTSFRIRLVLSIITYVLILVTVVLNSDDHFTSTMILIYAFSVFTGCFSIIRNYFTSIVQNEYVVKTEILRTLLGALLKIVLLWLEMPLMLFVIAALFDTLIIAGGYVFSYQSKVGKLTDWNYDRSLVVFFIKESFPLLLSGAAVVIYQRIDQVMIKHMIDNQSVGYFATASKFLSLILFLPTVLVQTITPILVKKKEINQNEYEKMKFMFVGTVVWFSIVVSLLVSFSAPWLVKYTFGEDYMPAVPVLQILAWKTVGMALSASAGQIIIMEHLQKWAVIKNLIGLGFCIILNWYFIPKMGILAAAWITIVTTAITGFIANAFIKPYNPVFRIQIKSLLLGWYNVIKIKKIFV